jgi:segregation and condensation protein B
MSLEEKVEAILYASENPLSVADIATVLNENKDEVMKALRALTKNYKKRPTSLDIVRTGIRYKMQLKNEFSDLVTPVSKREISNLELKILGFVAANPQCMRGDIVQHFGDRSRSPLEGLVHRKFLNAKKYRNTELYSVTREFYRYFNINKSELESRVKNSEETDKIE